MSGCAYGFGYSKHGQLGLKPSESPTYPTRIPQLDPLKIDPPPQLHCYDTKTFLAHKDGLLSFGGERGHLASTEMAWKGFSVLKVCAMGGLEVVVSRSGGAYVGGQGMAIPKKIGGGFWGPTFVDAAAGLEHALLLTSSGDLYSYTPSQDQAHLIPFFHLHKEKISSIACGARHSLALTTSGFVYSFGSNKYGQLGTSQGDVSVPTKVYLQGLSSQIACGEFCSFCVSGGKLFSWGRNNHGQLGQGDGRDRWSPALVSGLSECEILKVSSGGGYDCAHTLVLVGVGLGVLYGFGSGGCGQLGFPVEKGWVGVPTRVEFFDKKVIKDFSCGAMHSIVLVEEDSPASPTPSSNSFFPFLQDTRPRLGDFSVLPTELYRYILAYLDPFDLSRFSGTCKDFMFLSNDNILWEDITKRIYVTNYRYVKDRARAPWKSIFISMYVARNPVVPKKEESGLFSSLVETWRLFSLPVFKGSLLMIGLDAAGKTTILYKMRYGEIVTTIPTIGFNVETVEHKSLSITVWDVGGPDKIRALWRHYYQHTTSIIFVVDSSDVERISEASQELHKVLMEDELRNIPLLVFANKQDLPAARTVEEITDKLGLHTIRNRTWYIQPSCAITGSGLNEGFEWLSYLPQKSCNDLNY